MINSPESVHSEKPFPGIANPCVSSLHLYNQQPNCLSFFNGLQAGGFNLPLAGTFNIEFPESPGILTVQYELKETIADSYFQVIGESEHILYLKNFMTTENALYGCVELNNKLLKE